VQEGKIVDGELVVVNLRTRKSRSIPFRSGNYPVAISWSPTDPALVATGGSELYLVRIDGRVRRIATGRFGGWSPDGKRMVLSIGPSDGAKTIAITDRKGVVLRMTGVRAEAGPWSPTGKEIAVVAPDPLRRNRVHVMRPDGSHLRQLTPDTRIQGGTEVARDPQSAPRWSPDGRMLAFIEAPWATFPVLPDSQRETRETLVFGCGLATEVVRLGSGRPLWSPASRKIALSTCCAPPAVTVMRPDGRGPRWRFGLKVGMATEWSPDGRWFLLRGDRAPNSSDPPIIRLHRDRGKLEHLTTGEDAHISPRADWIAFKRSLGRCEAVFAMKLATRRVVRLTRC
jgi:dipeptidyl aminopeptidase/acylaminoacyl peptidase